MNDPKVVFELYMNLMNPPGLTDWSRFCDKFQWQAKGCWLWLGAKQPQGYGKFAEKGRALVAHRRIYNWAKGHIPPTLVVDHLCRQTSCVNPNHLEAVTHGENVLRGNSPIAKNARKTHCPKGHPYIHKNIVVYGENKNYRYCRACINLRQNAKRLAKRTST